MDNKRVKRVAGNWLFSWLAGSRAASCFPIRFIAFVVSYSLQAFATLHNFIFTRECKFSACAPNLKRIKMSGMRIERRQPYNPLQQSIRFIPIPLIPCFRFPAAVCLLNEFHCAAAQMKLILLAGCPSCRILIYFIRLFAHSIN